MTQNTIKKGISSSDNITRKTHGSAKRLPEMSAVEHVSQGVKVGTNPTQESLSTFQKELKGKLFKVFKFLAYERADVLLARSIAFKEFEKEIKDKFFLQESLIIPIAQKHFGKGD